MTRQPGFQIIRKRWEKFPEGEKREIVRVSVRHSRNGREKRRGMKIAEKGGTENRGGQRKEALFRHARKRTFSAQKRRAANAAMKKEGRGRRGGGAEEARRNEEGRWCYGIT